MRQLRSSKTWAIRSPSKSLRHYSPYGNSEYSISTPTFLWIKFVFLELNGSDNTRALVAVGPRAKASLILPVSYTENAAVEIRVIDCGSKVESLL